MRTLPYTRYMLSETLKTILRGVLETHPEIELALAFGSRARDVERPDSDLDLAVGGESLDTLALTKDLTLATDLEVHVAELRGAGYPLLQALLRDGIVVYEGRPHAAAEWRTAAVLITETDRPNWERMRDAYLQKLAAHG